LAKLQAFFDDSGINQPNVYVLAGFVAREDVWENFCIDWAAFLRAEPSLRYWKMSEVMSFRGALTKWPMSDRDEKVAQAIRIIEKHDLFFIAQSVFHDDFQRVLGDDYKRSKNWHPYRVLLSSLLISLDAYVLEKGVDEPISVIFDSQQGHEKQILDTWNNHYKSREKRTTVFCYPPEWHDEKKVLPIQAADLIAWELRNHMNRAIENKTSFRLPWAHQEKSQGVHHHLPPLALLCIRLLALYEDLIRLGILRDLWADAPEYKFYCEGPGAPVRRKRGIED
jgi:hypothetical protein